MNEEKNNYRNISTDNIQGRKKKNIGIITELDNLDNIQESSSLPNINSNEKSDKNNNDNNNTYKNEGGRYLKYKTTYNTLDADDIIKVNQNSHKKKVGKKINRNYKLLKIIKERMKEQKFKSLFQEENEEKMKNDNINNNKTELDKESNKKEEEKTKDDDEKNTSKNNEKEEKEKDNKENKEKINIEEEKKSKLLRILSSKKYNKFQKKDDKSKDKDNINLDNKNFSNADNDKDKIVKNPTNKIGKKENIKEIKKEKNTKNINKNDKLPEKTRKNKFTSENRSNTTPLLNNLNGKERSSSSKKGTFEILGLLKMKKKEEKENINSKEKRNKNEEKSENSKNSKNNRIIKKMDSYNTNPRKKILEKYKKDRNAELANSLPRKSFRDEEDDDENNYNNNIDYHNRTLQQFNNYKTSHSIKYPNNNNNRNRNKNYFNINNKLLNHNKNIRNNTIDHDNDFNITQILPKINRVNKNYNPISIKNKFREKLKNYYTLNDNENISPEKNYDNSESQKIKDKKNKRTLDNSYDLDKKPKNTITKKILNKSSLNQKVYKPKRISTNISPEKQNQLERNTIGTESINYNLKNTQYGNISKGIIKAYKKKSPENINEYNDSFNNNTIDNITNYNNRRKIYSKNSKKILNNYNNMNSFNNSIRNNSTNKFSTIESNTVKEPNLSIDTFTINKVHSINTNNHRNYFNNKVKNIKSSRMPDNNNSMLFNLEDLMILEEKLNDIISSLESNENIENKCFNFWNYYYNCSLYNILEKIFKNKDDSNIVRLSINYELISIMVCYEYSFQINTSDKEIYLLLLELMDLNYDNLIIICGYILTRIDPENKQNIWVLKLQQKIKSKNIQIYKNNHSQNSIEKIDININLIMKKLKTILLNYTTEYSDILISLLKQIDTKTYEEINDFFRKYILRVDNFEGSITASSYLKENHFFKTLPAPYLTFPPQKPYTLVLDLDETLVHFKIKTSKGGTLRARPYLFGFLEEMGHFYELVVWTSATEAYANSLIEAVEYEKNYFDYILYREHATIIGEDFVKDLTRIGRNLDRIIIIDDMPQNFRLQKENGINIRPFFGDDMNDSALYELVPILKHIAEDRKDVRIGLKKYREEIMKKVTSNISKQKNY